MIATLTPAQQRRIQRAAHVLAAVVLFAYVYAPLGGELQDVVRFVVFPVLALTGIAMWQSARIRRALRARRGTGPKQTTRTPRQRADRRWPNAATRNG
jgi:hypothetical protein